MRGKRCILGLILSTLIGSAGWAYAAEDRMMNPPVGGSRAVQPQPQALPAVEKKQPDPQVPQRVPPEKIQGPCPDLSADSIDLKSLRVYQSPKGPWAITRITGKAHNIGLGTFSGSGKLNLFEDSTLVAAQAFGSVPPGGEVTVIHERKWVPFSPGLPNFYKLEIVYDQIGAPDCNLKNNLITKKAQETVTLPKP